MTAVLHTEVTREFGGECQLRGGGLRSLFPYTAGHVRSETATWKYTCSFFLDTVGSWRRDDAWVVKSAPCHSVQVLGTPLGSDSAFSPALKVSKCHRTDGRETIVVFPRLTPPAEQPSLQERQSSHVTLGTRRLGADGTRQDPSLC